MITTQIEHCQYPGPWRFLRSSMTKWTMPKQRPHVLQIELRPRMDFSSCMYRLQVKTIKLSSFTVIVVLFILS
jgi:hypothetical protein